MCVINPQEPDDMEAKPIDWLMSGGQGGDTEARFAGLTYACIVLEHNDDSTLKGLSSCWLCCVSALTGVENRDVISWKTTQLYGA